MRTELNEVMERAAASVAEIRKCNRVVARLDESLKASRRKSRLQSAVLEQQEEAVSAERWRVAELELDVRRARDRLAMIELERDGLIAWRAAAREKLEEAEVQLAANEQAIAFMNRELNERSMRASARRGATGTRRFFDNSYDSGTGTGTGASSHSRSSSDGSAPRRQPPPQIPPPNTPPTSQGGLSGADSSRMTTQLEGAAVS
jgi:hypothetical protein